MGLRLPLESIQWVPPEEREIVYERDPLEPREESLEEVLETEKHGRHTRIRKRRSTKDFPNSVVH